MRYVTSVKVGTREIALDQPSYFIADIGANHDGDPERAKDLIWKAKEAGADAAKFQHFIAEKIVSDAGFPPARRPSSATRPPGPSRSSRSIAITS